MKGVLWLTSTWALGHKILFGFVFIDKVQGCFSTGMWKDMRCKIYTMELQSTECKTKSIF